MLRHAMRLRPQLHVPLRRLALCLDCEVCFELGPATCPACGSTTWTAIARFLEHAAASALEEAIAGPATAA
jgi:hypothetical protein